MTIAFVPSMAAHAENAQQAHTDVHFNNVPSFYTFQETSLATSPGHYLQLGQYTPVALNTHLNRK